MENSLNLRILRQDFPSLIECDFERFFKVSTDIVVLNKLITSYLKKLKKYQPTLNVEHLFSLLGKDDMNRPIIFVNILLFAKQEKFEITYFSVMEQIRKIVIDSNNVNDYILINDLSELDTKKILNYRSKMSKIMRYTEKYYPYLMYKSYALYASKSVKICFETLKKHLLSKETATKSIIFEKKMDLSSLLPPSIHNVLPTYIEVIDTNDEEMTEMDLMKIVSHSFQDDDDDK